MQPLKKISKNHATFLHNKSGINGRRQYILMAVRCHGKQIAPNYQLKGMMHMYMVKLVGGGCVINGDYPV